MGKSKSWSWTACGDIHGDHQDKATVEAYLAHVNDLSPDEIYLMGDLFDFRNLRSGASNDEKAESMELDIKAGLEFTERLFDR